MTAGKRPRLMMRRTVSVASLGGASGEVAAGSEHLDHHQLLRPPQHVVPPRQVIGFAAPGAAASEAGGGGVAGGGGGVEFSSASSPGTKTRPFSGLSILADPSGKDLGGAAGPPSPHGKVGLGIVAAMDKDDLACSSPTSVIRAAMAQAGVANNFHHHHHHQHQVHGRSKTAADSAAFRFCLQGNSKCSLRPSFTMLGFLESCYQCKRDISHGRDIFMYRGDKAFCSAECRHQQILNDERLERRDKCASAALKQMGSVPQQARRNERAKVTPATTAAAA